MKSFFLIAVFLFLSRSMAAIVINEFMAANDKSFQDPQEAGEYPDWIELYNSSDVSVDVGGYYLTDNPARPTKWTIAAGTRIAAKGFLLFIADSDPEQGALHTSFKLASDGGYIGLRGYDNVIVDSLSYTKQYDDISFGRSPDGSANYYYFDAPTPEAKNSNSGFRGVVGHVQFSHARGFYDTSFSLTLSADQPDAQIFYTLDGSEPRNRVGAGCMLYSAPIQITTTRTVRAQAFLQGWRSMNALTNSYLFLRDVIRQPADPDGFPQNWGWTGDGDYEMDPDVVDDPAYSGTILDDMQAAPSLSLVMDVDDWFGTGGQGIYLEGELDERAVSAELIHPDGSPGFQINCAVMIVGGTSPNRWKMDKLSMRLKFKSEYGAANLDYPLFGDDATDQFQTLVLDARMNNSWAYGGGTSINGRDLTQNDIAQYTRDQFVADLHAEMGGLAVHGRQVHLYLNGLYWGLYWVHERPDEHFAASYRGGDDQDYDVIKHNPDDIVSGSNANYKEMFAIANSSRSSAEKYDLLSQYLDIPDFIDYMIVNYYVGNVDWAHQNWYATRSRYAPENKWRYHSWDAEHVMEGLLSNNLNRNDDGGPTRLHHVLRQHPEYRRLFADHVYAHFNNDGILTESRARQIYGKLLQQVDRAVVGESARWGDNHRNRPYTRNVEWVRERDWLLNTYFPGRGTVVLQQIHDQDLFPNVTAPLFLIDGAVQHGGRISRGAALSMSAAAGAIYYTTNGADPLTSEIDNENQFVIAPQNARKRVLVPSATVGGRWRIDPAFDDSAWKTVDGGAGGIGYEIESGYESLISLDVQDEMYDPNDNGLTSCFIRIPFQITAEQLPRIKTLLLHVYYDDGFVAWINGFQAASANSPESPTWDSVALGNHEAETREIFSISSAIEKLKVGANLLAIHAMNVHSRSSDFIIAAELTASEDAGGGSLSPDAREYTAPLSLNQSVEIRARSLNGGEWSPVHRAVYAIPEKMAQLRLTEIHFHPLDEADTNDREFEFLELKNIGAEAINLSLAGFRTGINYTFASGTVLAPKQLIVLASNRAMFERRYGFAPFAAYDGNLDNAGERIVFVNAAGDTILNVRYNDKEPWPESADGGGHSLVAGDVDPQGDPNSPDYWLASYDLHGSPGRDDRAATLVHGHESMPARYDLAQNYPNPFNARTTIRFELPRSGIVQLTLYNILGQKVFTLANGQFDAGVHHVQWDATDFAGGLYFCRMQAGEFVETKKLILMK